MKNEENLTYVSLTLKKSEKEKLEYISNYRYRGIGGKMMQTLRDLIEEEYERVQKREGKNG